MHPSFTYYYIAKIHIYCCLLLLFIHLDYWIAFHVWGYERMQTRTSQILLAEFRLKQQLRKDSLAVSHEADSSAILLLDIYPRETLAHTHTHNRKRDKNAQHHSAHNSKKPGNKPKCSSPWEWVDTFICWQNKFEKIKGKDWRQARCCSDVSKNCIVTKYTGLHHIILQMFEIICNKKKFILKIMNRSILDLADL